MYEFIAHRGNTKYQFVSNTKEAMLSALSLPYISGVEMDIRKTKDNHLVLSHDPYVILEDGFHLIAHENLSDLQVPYLGHTEQIAVLSDVLSRIQSDKKIIIEAKVDKIEDLLYETIQPFHSLNLYICSFNYEFAVRMKKKYSDCKVGLILGNFINQGKNINFFDFFLIPPMSLEQFKTKKETMVWTIDQKKELIRIDTNHPIITNCAECLISHNHQSQVLQSQK